MRQLIDIDDDVRWRRQRDWSIEFRDYAWLITSRCDNSVNLRFALTALTVKNSRLLFERCSVHYIRSKSLSPLLLPWPCRSTRSCLPRPYHAGFVLKRMTDPFEGFVKSVSLKVCNHCSKGSFCSIRYVARRLCKKLIEERSTLARYGNSLWLLHRRETAERFFFGCWWWWCLFS